MNARKLSYTRRDFLSYGVRAAAMLLAAQSLLPERGWAQSQYSFTRAGRKYPRRLKMASVVGSPTPGYVWEYTDLVKRQLGIEAEWRTHLAGAQMMQAFAIGQWDIGYVGVPPLVTGIAQGMKASAIAVGHSQGSNVIGRKDRGFKTIDEFGGDLVKSWQQFRGKVVGLPPRASIQDAITRTALTDAGLSDRDVDLRNYDAVPSLPDLLEQGQIDAFVGWPPFDVIATGENRAGMILIPGDRFGSKEWSGYPMNCLVASEQLIREYPDVVEDCVFLHTKVNYFLMAYPEQAAKMIAALQKISEPATLKGYHLTPNYCPDITDATIASCVRFVRTLMEAKYIQRAVTAEQIFNTSFIRRVHPAQCTARVGKVAKDPQLFEFIVGRKP